MADYIRLLTEKIRKIYARHFARKMVATVLIICLIIGFLRYIPVLGVKAGPLPEADKAELSKTGEEISHDMGEVLVAESDSKQLYINSKTMNLKLKDKNTGKVWNSTVNGSNEASELAMLTVSYLGKDNNLTEWDSYTYCTQLGSYVLKKIDNGVQITMDINEGESERFPEYYPQKMPTDRFENFFLAGIKNLVETGKIDQVSADKYKMTLELLYKKSITEDCYAVSYNGTPPRSAVKQLIKLAELLGYTKEMLISDSNEMGLSVTFTEPAQFKIVAEATLDGDDFVFRVPTQQMVSGNSYYTIQNIKVLPNFGAAASKEYEDGYILVPDGAGALFKFNTFNMAVPDYIRPIYNNNSLADYYFAPEYGEELMMPVFGMTYGTMENASHGFLGIIEKGAETSYINVKLASTAKDSASSYNKAYASFDAAQYSNVKVYGPYSDNKASYLVDTGVLDVDYTIRYKLFPGNVSYFDMAKTYQEYLMKQGNITKLSYPDKAKVYMDFLGTISLTKRFLGIPYQSSYSVTTYKELSDIIKDLPDVNMALQYTGFFNGGFENKLNNRAELTSANGSKEELKELRNLAGERKADMFFDVSLSKVYDKGNGFRAKTHAVYDYSNSPATIYRYLPSLGILDGFTGFDVNYFYLLSPRYLDGVVNKFLDGAKEYDKLAISDLAHYNMADYRFKKKVSVYEAGRIAEDSLKKLSESHELSLENPMMKNVLYGSYAEDISRESSDYASFYITIPFRQLVMNGLVQVTTENVNMSSENPAYYVLQSVELGVYPKFTLSAKSDDILQETAYSYYYATEYQKQKDTIQKVYSQCKNAWEKIGTMEITGHKILSDNVFCTEYASGARVITNYNLHSVVVDGSEIPALGFIISGK
ncbi:DUF5696 domain-containing protein [Anaerocolumna chitinilytica]|uniref:Uncharacterized protein n=1 Tax=Anaerocolumna chitinilytica TaxID=1727145 RepID=A0A7I8DN58_9FIRM|nr:DUF5696 domain-containing protein [Anaerocolumna chitinilytica]BCJ99848.1 hypothetical protein bsdcttw_28890 [Anaerocolumna chitinilytica]